MIEIIGQCKASLLTAMTSDLYRPVCTILYRTSPYTPCDIAMFWSVFTTTRLHKHKYFLFILFAFNNFLGSLRVTSEAIQD